MAEISGVEMNESDVAEYLTRQGHGVLTFSGEKPYGVPISFAYDEQNNRCVFQLLSTALSRKAARLRESDAATLIVYEWNTPDDWRSVILEGSLEEIEPESTDAIAAAEVFAEHASMIGSEIFAGPLEELDVQWYGLRIDAISGYHSPFEF